MKVTLKLKKTIYIIETKQQHEQIETFGAFCRANGKDGFETKLQQEAKSHCAIFRQSKAEMIDWTNTKVFNETHFWEKEVVDGDLRMEALAKFHFENWVNNKYTTLSHFWAVKNATCRKISEIIQSTIHLKV